MDGIAALRQASLGNLTANNVFNAQYQQKSSGKPTSQLFTVIVRIATKINVPATNTSPNSDCSQLLDSLITVLLLWRKDAEVQDMAAAWQEPVEQPER